MELKSEAQGDLHVVTVLAGRLDAAVAIRFKETMRTVIDQAQTDIVLGLGQVAFIDSSGLGAIVASMKLMPQGAKMALAGLTPAVDKVFRMTRMDSIFTIYSTAQDALAARA
mgnify:CR=1 FL=1